MQKVLTAEQMREVDRLTTERYGIPSIVLMENAASAVARVITEKLGGSVKGKSILILCGKGNNGGDGAALARILADLGAILEVYTFEKVAESKGDARTNFEQLRAISSSDYDDKGPLYFEDNVLIDYWVNTTGFEIVKFDLLVDALLGTGLTRPLDLLYSHVPLVFSTKHLDKAIPIVSVDIPSGLFSDSHELPELYIEATTTVTFTAPKPANVLPPASQFSGELRVADIGSPQELIDEQPSQLYLAERDDPSNWLEKTAFSNDDYKNKRGHVLLIAGSANYSGAAVLCGNAAMRSGAGLVTIVTPKSSKESVASRVLPEVMVRGVAETQGGAISDEAFRDIGELLDKADSIAIGSGLSQNESTKRFVEKVIENRRQPAIIDADALNLLSPFANLMQKPEREQGRNMGVGHYALANARASASDLDTAPLILTPHEGEFIRLLGTDDRDAIQNRVGAVRDFAGKTQCYSCFKGRTCFDLRTGR